MVWREKEKEKGKRILVGTKYLRSDEGDASAAIDHWRGTAGSGERNPRDVAGLARARSRVIPDSPPAPCAMRLLLTATGSRRLPVRTAAMGTGNWVSG